MAEATALNTHRDSQAGGYGLHHVTAIAGSPHVTLDFYTRVLGLRLVKRTVNYDDPQTYHFYFGDEVGRPGSLLTFFPMENAERGYGGLGLTQTTLLQAPLSSLGYWLHRMLALGVKHEALAKRFGLTELAFEDSDGLRLAIVFVPGLAQNMEWRDGPIPPEHMLQGLFGVTLLVDRAEPTTDILRVLGFEAAESEDQTLRFRSGARTGGVVDLRLAPGFFQGQMGRGSVHHVAFRATDQDAQMHMVGLLAGEHGMQLTDVKDRTYFQSVYFREPGGVLFEIATDCPGFVVDEPIGSLGSSLLLPTFLEADREAIERSLPVIADAIALKVSTTSPG